MSLARIVFFGLLLVVLFGVVAFAVLNPDQRVDTDLYFAEYIDVPLVQVLFMAFVLGGALALIYMGLILFDFQRRIRAMVKDKRQMERELSALRTLPLEESPSVERESPEPFSTVSGGSGTDA